MIIFDFDGVLADSFSALYEINSFAAKKIGKDLSENSYRECFNGPVHKMLSSVLNLSSAEEADFRKLKNVVFEEYYNPSKVKLHTFAPDLVKQISLGNSMVIASSAPENIIHNTLSANGLNKYFAGVYGLNREGKERVLKNVMENEKPNFFITDTVGDILDASKVTDLKTIAVQWGFQGGADLIKAEPYKLARSAEELCSIIYES